MQIGLSGNIRALRKERGLTQEQLAEVLGVTVGAVHKWESGLNMPDILLLIRMADFFDTSVDALLGYRMNDNRLETMEQRLREYRRKKDREGLAEAEKALKKYHYSFRIVYQCALLYSGFGFESGDRALLRRALELFERSRMLLGQNGDPEIGDQTICGKIARVYLALDETEKGVELLKKSNVGGILYPLRVRADRRGRALSFKGVHKHIHAARRYSHRLHERVHAAGRLRFRGGDTQLGRRRVFGTAQGLKAKLPR